MKTEKAERAASRKNKQTMFAIDMKTREIEETHVDLDYRGMHPETRPGEDIELTKCSECGTLGHQQKKYTKDSVTEKWVHVVRIKASRKGAKMSALVECVVPE